LRYELETESINSQLVPCPWLALAPFSHPQRRADQLHRDSYVHGDPHVQHVFVEYVPGAVQGKHGAFSGEYVPSHAIADGQVCAKNPKSSPGITGSTSGATEFAPNISVATLITDSTTDGSFTVGG
jgi:hypothetical protein